MFDTRQSAYMPVKTFSVFKTVANKVVHQRYLNEADLVMDGTKMNTYRNGLTRDPECSGT